MECEKLGNCGDQGVHECCCEYIDNPSRCVRKDVDEASACPRFGIAGVCACCHQADRDATPTPASGRPIIVYELPQPIFDDLSTTKKDYVRKPLPKKEMFPWHPIKKLRWQPLDVASLVKTTYQIDYSPPKVDTNYCPPPADIPVFPPIKEEKPEPHEEHRLCKRMTRGADHVHGVCEKTHLREGLSARKTYAIEDRQAPCRQCNCCTYGNPPNKPPEQHDPKCELYCMSSDVRCHDEDPPQSIPIPRPPEARRPPPRPVRTIPGKFTVCENDNTGNEPQRWWVRGCDPNKRSDDCDCTGNMRPERYVKFERGGLIP